MPKLSTELLHCSFLAISKCKILHPFEIYNAYYLILLLSSIIWLNTNKTSWPLTVQNRWKHSTQPPMTHSPMPHSLMTPFSQCPIWSMPPIHQWPPFSNNSFTNDPIQPMLPFTNDPIQPVTTIHQCPILNDPFIKFPFMKDSSSQWPEFTNASFSK